MLKIRASTDLQTESRWQSHRRSNKMRINGRSLPSDEQSSRRRELENLETTHDQHVER